jgi:hypothetical protein
MNETTEGATLDPIEQSIAEELAKDSPPLETENKVEATQTDDTPQDVETAETDGSEYVETESDKVQKRINKKHFEMMEEKRRADALEERLKQLEAQNAQTIPAQPDSEEPRLEHFKEEDFNYDDTARIAAFTDALTPHRINKTLENREGQLAEQQRQLQEQQRQAELSDKFLSEVADYSVKNPSYMEDIQNLPQLSQDKLDLVRSQGAKMVHYLSKNPEAANQFAQADFGSAAVQLGMLNAQLNTKPTTTNISSAPQPVETVSGNSGALDKDLGEMSMAEIMAL